MKTRGLDRVFTYKAEPACGAMPDASLVGYSCVVAFNNRPVAGYVVAQCEELSDTSYEILPVHHYISGPYFKESSARVARWICDEYGSTLAESLRLFIPPQGKVSLEYQEDGSCTEGHGGPKPRFQSFYVLTEAGREANFPARAKKRQALREVLHEGEQSKDALKARLGDTITPYLNDFVKTGLVVERKERIYRGDISFDARNYARPAALNDEQILAVNVIAQAVSSDQPRVFVLDGVTGSGKTEVYLQVIEQAVAQGKTGLVLVPEISLTPQTVGRFQSRFPGRVAVLHSRLTEVERQDQWERIRRGGADVVVGARSALFAPLENLGIVVIDEEHDGSYKQGSSPRYHARDVACFMCKQLNIPLVLGSATPSFEALYQCKEGLWELLELPHRANNTTLPEGRIVDLTKEFEAGNRSMFSRDLQVALERVLEKREKALLLLNRRGSASFLLCRECGYVPTCPDCSTSLTYHEHDHHLRCHQCNRIEHLPAKCPECGSPYLQQFNAGTQRLESALKALYPDTSIIRMDADTTSERHGHQKLLDEFANLESGILIGTQMIAKGLDFPEVTLVGVVTADTVLNLPDYQAGERTYQLLEQVSGRAGRGEKSGEVIIQTYWPEHRAILAAAHHDRDYFYDFEAQVRRELAYPPFKRLANVIVSSFNQSEAQEAAQNLARRLGELASDLEILGPAPCVIEKINKKFRFHFLVKAQREEPLGRLINDSVRSLRCPKGVGIAIDVDPLSLM